MTSSLLISGILMVLLSAAAPAWAQDLPTQPDLSVCDGLECEPLLNSICSNAGFRITLTDYDPATLLNDNTATYKYEICNPPLGVCQGGTGLMAGQPCYDNSFCRSNGAETDPTATCSRDCVVDNFYDLNHFDVTFPEIGRMDDPCLAENTSVTGTCKCGAPEVCDVNPTVLLGDGDCFGAAPDTAGDKVVAGCYYLFGFNPGRCMVMTLSIASENPGLGLGPAVVVDATGQSCNASCLPGPSCETCGGPPPNAGACLTRTHGFWANHPLIASEYDGFTVCGFYVQGQDAWKCSTYEALCSNANDFKQNPAYLSLVAQLTAAKLNLNAAAALSPGAMCSTWRYQDVSIQEWIKYCEAQEICGGSKKAISGSGCIEALTAFNESQETGFEGIPSLFDRPGPADPRECQEARGNGIYIGNCKNPEYVHDYSQTKNPGRGRNP